MADYIILEAEQNSQLSGAVSTERPQSDGTKGELKKLHGMDGHPWFAGLAVKYLRFMATKWQVDYNTERTGFSERTRESYSRSPVAEILRNYDYYNAQQDNYAYAYLSQGADGQELAAPWTAGHEIYQTVQHMVGPVRNHLKSSHVKVESLDPSVVSIKQARVAMLQAKKDLARIFSKFAEMGAEFMPEGGEQDIDKALQDALRQPAHKVERFGLDLLNRINAINRHDDFFAKRYMDTIIGRYAGLHVESHFGRIAFDSINPERLIWDRGDEDDDYNRYSLYKGFVHWKSREEIISAYDLGEDAKKVLDALFTTNGSNTQSMSMRDAMKGGPLNTGFQWIDGDGAYRVGCVTGYFIVTEHTKEGGRYHTVYRGTLIGDRILVDFGKANNIIYDDKHPEWPLMPIWIYSPDTVRGRNVCPVDRFRQMQDDCDAYLHKIRQKISRDLGKTFVIRASAIGGDTATVSAITADLKNHSITVLNDANGEEAIANARPVDMLDFSLDPNIVTYISLRKEMMQEMRDVVSQSRVTQGMQQTYIGGGTQSQTIAQASNGTVMLMQGFFQWFAMVQEYTLNVAKVMILAAENREEAELVLSEAAGDFLEAIKDLNLSDIQVVVELEDIIDDTDRQEYKQLALAALQNAKDTGFTFLDYIDVMHSRTATELRRKLKESLERAQLKQDRIRAQEQQIQMAMQQQALQAGMQTQAMKDQNSAQREIIRQTPNAEKNQIEREKLGLERDMVFASEAGMPGTEVDM